MSAVTRPIGFIALASLAAAAQARLVWMFQQDDFNRSAEAALGVVNGLPHWRIYQSRVLGPYLVNWLTATVPGYAEAFFAFAVLALAFAGFLTLVLAFRLFRDTTAALACFFIMHAMFAFLLAHPWLYAWDFGSLILFTIFVYLVMSGGGWFSFTLLFLVAVLNRESALFIALWMIANPLLRWLIDAPGDEETSRSDRKIFLAGAACVAAGLVIIERLRTTLLVREIAPEAFGDPSLGSDFHLRLWDNLAMIRRVFTEFVTPRFDRAMYFMVPIFIGMIVLLALALIRRNAGRFLGLALVHMALLASVLAFGVLLEARIYIEFIPFVAFGLVLLMREQA